MAHGTVLRSHCHASAGNGVRVPKNHLLHCYRSWTHEFAPRNRFLVLSISYCLLQTEYSVVFSPPSRLLPLSRSSELEGQHGDTKGTELSTRQRHPLNPARNPTVMQCVTPRTPGAPRPMRNSLLLWTERPMPRSSANQFDFLALLGTAAHKIRNIP